jgi:putative DNA primase/helicase
MRCAGSAENGRCDRSGAIVPPAGRVPRVSAHPTASFRTLGGTAMTARKHRAASPTVMLRRLPDLGAPFDVARTFLASEFSADGCRTLHHHRGVFYAWNNAAYLEIDKDDVRARLYAFLDQCKTGVGKGEKVKPNTALVSGVIDALTAHAQLDRRISAPYWLDNRSDLPAGELIACANGLLHLPTLKLLPHTPAFFTNSAVDFVFDPNAPAPGRWLKFLAELWPDDPQAIETLQELLGYCLTADTSQQKMFLLVGPPRSGKGTIARMLRQLLGIDNTVAPTLAQLSSNFGIAPLIGKRVAIISDARLGKRTDQHVIAERLLSITGEDAITADRKYLSAWTGRLQTRFVILSNELPQLEDPSGALASRFVVLTLRQSFYGREDHELFERLLPELPGILSWAIEGWRRLSERGSFVMPASSANDLQQLEDLGSPIKVFVRDHCDLGAGHTVEARVLFESWRDWCCQQNRNPGTAEQFGKDLRAAVPGIKVAQPRATGRRRVYEGIGLLSDEPKATALARADTRWRTERGRPSPQKLA